MRQTYQNKTASQIITIGNCSNEHDAKRVFLQMHGLKRIHSIRAVRDENHRVAQ